MVSGDGNDNEIAVAIMLTAGDVLVVFQKFLVILGFFFF